MATGDVQGGVERLRSELRHIRYPAELDCTGAKLGVAAAFLPVLNYVLLKFSRHVAHQLVSSGYELQGKTDARFVEAAFKIFRDKFGLRPVITAAQFLEQGFAERKLMLLSDVIAYCKSFHNAAVRRARLAAASAPTKSGKDGATSSKAGLSQASKGSRSSKARSGLSKAGQPARVQRHSAAVSEDDSTAAAAAATLQARLAPSAAQLAHPDQSQNIDPNPWSPPAHAVGSCAIPGRQAIAMRTSNVRPRLDAYQAHSTGAVGSATAHQGQQQQQQQQEQQQQHTRLSTLPSRTQPKAGSMLEATQAWFMNPAFGGESPLPSPEKQPRSQPPPQPYPSTCTGLANAAGQPAAGQHAAGLSGDHATASWSQGSPTQQTAAGSAGYTDKLHGEHVPSYSPGMQSMAAPTQARQHQQLWGNVPQAPVQIPEELAPWPESAGASQQLPAHAGKTAAQCPSHSLHNRHGFPSLPLRQRHQQTPQHKGNFRQPGYPNLPGSLVQHPTQHAQQGQLTSPYAAAHAHSSEQHMHQQQQQHQDVAAQNSWQGQQHKPRQEPGAVCSDDRMSEYVGQLRERLAEAEERAAHAELEGDGRVQTLEARITLLEGRVRFVEGELAAERERNRSAAQPDAADAKSPHRPYSSPCKGQIAVCLSPSSARCKQQTNVAPTAATASNQRQPIAEVFATQPVTRSTASMQRGSIGSSPTRSTAGTPGYKSAKYGCTQQLGLGAHLQQSPSGMRRTKAAVAPASPASSMHSYKSTSELIESIQNRYLEAQSFLKSYKL